MVKKFSYNKTVGKRTKENGFGEAGAYLNGETVQEVGVAFVKLLQHYTMLLFYLI